MEESNEVQCEENKAFPEEKKGRKFKSREQLQGLEDFYTEHKYPTESMKSELARKLDLTDKQVSGWFCHRRLKDKRLLKEESQAPGRQDLSSGVVQDRGSGLRQDSCSSTKQADYRLADVREVESRRFARENLPAVELNYQQKRLGNVNEMDDTSSESNSAEPESLYPQNRSHLEFEATEFRASNGFIPHARGRAGPSGYLKIKGHTENAAITAVKRQLGRHYREDGPSLGIEFDPLPPGAFEFPSKNINDDAYGVPEPYESSPVDTLGIHKHTVPSTIKEDIYEATDYKQLHKLDPDNIMYRQSKQKLPFPNHSRCFPDQKSSLGVDSYYARETSDYDNSRNLNMRRKHDSSGMRSDTFSDLPPYPYNGKISCDTEDAAWPDQDNVNLKAVRRREQFVPRPVAPPVRRRDPIYKEDRMPSSRIVMDEEPFMDRRPMSEHHDSVRLNMRPTNEIRANKRGREELFQEDYPIRKSPQEPPQWSKPIKGSMEMPSSFSEDETAETSSSME